MAVVIRRATSPAEVAGIKALQNANLASRLSEAERAAAGFVTAEYSLEFLLAMHEETPAVIAMDEGVNLPAPVMGVDPDNVEVGTRVAATLRRMKLGHEGDIYYSYKFVVDDDPAPTKKAPARKPAAKKPAARKPAVRKK